MAKSNENLKFPYEIVELETELTKKISADFSDGISKLILVGDEKMLLPGLYEQYADDYYNLKLRNNDVIITGYPRSGTTLTQELVWLLQNDLNFDMAKDVHYQLRSPFLEGRVIILNEKLTSLMHEKLGKLAEKERTLLLQTHIDTLENLNAKTENRVFKTHLHLKFLPPNLLENDRKIIYLARNPKDVIVSFYHLQSNLLGMQFTKDFPTFFRYFKNDLIHFTPYWAHIKQGWEMRNCKNVRFVFYEDLVQDLRQSIVEIAIFLNKKLNEDQIDKLHKHLNFDNFKNHINTMNSPAVELVRRGKIGGWRDYFDEALNNEANLWIRENVQKIGIEYPFDLY